MKSYQSKTLHQILEQVPADYYEHGIKNNLLQRFWHLNKIKNFRKLVRNQHFRNILDVGCAGGYMTNEIAKMFPCGQVTGVDAYTKAISYATKRFPHIYFIKTDAHTLPFKNNYFDLVVCYETIEHVKNPEKVLAQIYRVLQKGGVAIIAMDSGNLLFRLVWYVWEKTKGSVWQGAHLHPFHHDELENKIKKAGFIVTKKHFSHLWMEVSFLVTK